MCGWCRSAPEGTRRSLFDNPICQPRVGNRQSDIRSTFLIFTDLLFCKLKTSYQHLVLILDDTTLAECRYKIK